MSLELVAIPKTMSSLEIAELTTKEHRNVVVDILKMLDDLGSQGADFSAPYKMPSGQSTTIYNLPKRECLILVSGYNLKLRAGIIDRWEELEKANMRSKTRLELAKEQVAMIEEIERLEQELIKESEAKTRLQISTNKLEVKLDILLDHISIIKVAAHNKVKETEFKWQFLKRTSEQLGYEIKKADSPRYGYMNLYHVNVFKTCYPQHNYEIKTLL